MFKANTALSLIINPHTPEDELISLSVAGNTAAFEQIMRRNNQLLFRTARSILKNDEAAEDAVQEAYIRAWQKLGTFDSRAKLSTWLVRIVTNECLGRLRRITADIIPLDDAMESTEASTQKVFTETPDEQPDSQLMRAQLRKILELRIDKLPDVYRTVFILRAVEEMSIEEIAKALDIPEATVRSRFFRARSILREKLASSVDTTISEVFSFDGARCDRIVNNVLARIEK